MKKILSLLLFCISFIAYSQEPNGLIRTGIVPAYEIRIYKDYLEVVASPNIECFDLYFSIDGESFILYDKGNDTFNEYLKYNKKITKLRIVSKPQD